MARFVPRKRVTIRDKGFTQTKFQRAHWADASGRWVAAPSRASRPTPGATGTTTSSSSSSSSTGYHGLSDDEINARANAYADSAIAAKTAAIQRAQAMARAQAQQDAEQMGQIGQAQMGMINQIPANIQAIRNRAGEAISSFAGQVTGAQQQQVSAEQAANAAFSASQTGGTPAAAPAGAPAPAGGAIGVDPAAAAAAENAMGGQIPAVASAQMGEAGAIYAAGMPAVVARATQNKIAERMAQAASEDADYRQQLIDAAAERGGAYADALGNLYDIETKKFGIYQAQQNLKNDQQDMLLKKQEMALRVRAELANEVQFGIKTKAQALKDWQNYQLAQGRLEVSQTNATTSAGRAALAGADYYTDGKGRVVPKGYKYNASGQLVKMASPGTVKAPKGGPAKAASMAGQLRGTVWGSAPGGKGGQVKLMPKVGYRAAYNQIHSAMLDLGYKDPEAASIARHAVDSHYGPGFRPKEFR